VADVIICPVPIDIVLGPPTAQLLSPEFDGDLGGPEIVTVAMADVIICPVPVAAVLGSPAALLVPPEFGGDLGGLEVGTVAVADAIICPVSSDGATCAVYSVLWEVCVCDLFKFLSSRRVLWPNKVFNVFNRSCG
jgi:hypothetical protein